MTAQFSETLIYHGEHLSMCTEPLDDYFLLSNNRPDFESPSTALWRGYIGHWEIIEERLYLTEIHGSLKDGSAVTLETIFPGFPKQVFAHWYSGNLRVPKGKMLEYVHMGYGSKYEQDLLIDVEKGVVVKTHIMDNGISDKVSGSEGYAVGAFTLFSLTKDKSGL